MDGQLVVQGALYEQKLAAQGAVGTKKLDALLRENEELIMRTASICPECYRLIPMVVFDRDGKALLRKECKEHGIIEDVYWGDSAMFKKAKKWEVAGKGIANYKCCYNKSMRFDMLVLLLLCRESRIHLRA